MHGFGSFSFFSFPPTDFHPLDFFAFRDKEKKKKRFLKITILHYRKRRPARKDYLGVSEAVPSFDGNMHPWNVEKSESG